MSDAIRVDVIFEPTGTKKNFDKVESQAKKAGQKASVSFSKGFSDSISKSMAGVRSQIVSTVGAFFAFNVAKDALVGAVNASLEFEQSIKEVNTILPKNTKLTEIQTRALRDYAKQFGTDASSQVKSYYQIISAGVTDTAKANKLLAEANKLSIGGLTSVGASIDILTSIINGYGAENITAQEAADSLFTAVRLGKTTVDELANSLSTVIPGARAVGVNLDTVNASMAVLTSNGIDTATAVTKLNALFNAIAKNGAKLGEGMNSAALASDGLVTVLQRLESRTGGSTDKLLALLGRTEAVQAAQVLMRGSANDLNKALGEMATKAGSSERAFGEMSESGAQQMKLLKAEVKDLGISLGENITPALLALISRFKTVGSVVKDSLGKQAKTPLEETQMGINKLTLELADLYKKQQDLKKESEGGVGLIRQMFLPGQMKDVAREIQIVTEKMQTLKGWRDQMNEVNENAARQAERDGWRGEYEEMLRVKNEQAAIAAAKVQAAEQEKIRREAEAAQAEFDRQSKLDAQGVFVENTQEQFKGLVSVFGASSMHMTKMAQEAAGAVYGALTNGFGKAFQNVGKALADGQSGMQAFVDGMKAMVGEIASALGDMFIKWGIANLASPATASIGIAQIAGGAALKVLSGALGSSSGGGSSQATGGGAGVGAQPVTVDNAAINQQQETQRSQEQVNLSLNVEGSVVRESELSGYVSNILEMGSTEDGNVVPSLKTGFS